MHRHLYVILTLLFIYIPFSFPINALARWETGAKLGFDTNIDRAVDGGTSDSYLTGFLTFTRDPEKDSNIDWTLDLGIEGTGYNKSSDLNYGMATFSPALIIYPGPIWRVDISPFLQAIVVSDSEQSGLALGGEVNIMQSWNRTFYTGEYFLYTDNRADVDIYSYKEKTAGVFAGINWSDAFWSDAGYEYSYGDSFRAVGEVSTTTVGRGKSRRYSQAYNEYLINEPVDRYTVSVNMGYQISRHVFSFVNYAYTSYSGDAGTSESHTGAVGMGYSF